MQDRILEIKDLQIAYDEELAVKGASLFVERGEVLCIVGESGSGKSTVIKAIIGNKQVKVKGGEILFEGENLVPMKKAVRQKLLGTRIGLIQQNPAGAFNPIRKFNIQFKETLKSHMIPFIKEKLDQLFVTLGLKNTTGILKSRPYEMSDGMNQRIAIAAAMLMDPELLLCDEITSALDVTTAISVTDELLREITRKHIEAYIAEDLNNFEEKTERFRHLFERLCEDVYPIVKDMADELRKSDFEPIRFELKLSDSELGISVENGDVRLSGTADRVDGWEKDGILYLRIVDYKTGRRSFSLSDVWYGYNMQMLLYLFAVCDRSEELFDMPGEPAGILYLPARENMLAFDSEPNTEELEKKKAKGKRRSGLVINSASVVEAWENGENKQYLPEKTRNSDPLVSPKQLGILRRHVIRTLDEMASELRDGKIDANPGWESSTKNACMYCDYHAICHFEEGEGGEHSHPMPKLNDSEVWELLESRGE